MTTLKHSTPGYTLVELLVVLAIIGTISALAVPIAGRLIDGVKLQSDARALMVALRESHESAVNEQRTIVVQDDAKAAHLVTNSGISLDLPDGSTARLMGADAPIAFFPDGTSNGGKLRVSLDGISLDVRVTWLVGDIELEDSQ